MPCNQDKFMNGTVLIKFMFSNSFFVLLFSAFLPIVLAVEEYYEIATLTYLPNYNILSEVNFNFKSTDIRSSSNSLDLGNFPSLIHSLSADLGLLEGKLTFTRGIWDSSRWSKAPNNPASSGFQFHGHFSDQHESDLSIEERFNRAIQLISGYFCASLNILKYSNAIKPTIPSFPLRNSDNFGSTSVLVGIIPNEPVCVENLQPFFDLLPCSNRAGVAQMLKQEAIYQSDFHSIEVEFFTNSGIELNLRMVTVYDLGRWDRNNNWTLASLFGRAFDNSCPFKDAKLVLRIPKGDEMFLNSLHHQNEKISAFDGHFEIVYNGKDLLNEIGASNVPKLSAPIDKVNPYKAFRFKSGTDDMYAGFGLVLINDSIDPVDVSVIESIPWLFRVFMHEGEFALNSKPIPTSKLSEYLKEFSIEPSINRQRNLLLQSKWRIPPKSQIQVYFPLEREFLHLEEFPPNSERGIELPGALIFYHDDLEGLISSTETTNTLLFTWPIPDVTMPFNVITMTSTLSALFYGSFFNLIFRRFYLRRPDDPPAGLLPKLAWNLKKILFTKNKRQ